MDDVAWLVAIERIKILRARYCRALDFKDYELLESLFTEDVAFDFRRATDDSSTGNSAAGGAPDQVLRGRDVVVSMIRKNGGVLKQQVHNSHTAEIEILSDTTAKGIWAMSDRIRFPDGPTEELTGFGYYYETYEKVGDEWKIKAIRCQRLWVDCLPRG